MDRSQLLDANRAQMRLNVERNQLSVPLESFAPDIAGCPIAIPSIKEFGDGRPVRIDAIAGGVLRYETRQLKLGGTPRAFEARVPDAALAGHRICADIKF